MPLRAGPSCLVSVSIPQSRRPPGARTSTASKNVHRDRGRGRPARVRHGRGPSGRYDSQALPHAGSAQASQPADQGFFEALSTAAWSAFWRGHSSGASQSDRFFLLFDPGSTQPAPSTSHDHGPETIDGYLELRYSECIVNGCGVTVRSAVTILSRLFDDAAILSLSWIRRKYHSILKLSEQVQAWHTRFWLRICQYYLIEYTICRFCLFQQQDVSAKRMQIETVWQLTFNHGDAILVAPCGYGKSVVFHAFTILTGSTTIMVVPLSVIGNQQQCIVNAVAGARGGDSSANVDGQLHAKFLDATTINAAVSGEPIVARIRDGTYNFLITSPEVLIDNVLGAILREYGIAKLGLIAIDELHLVRHWDLFRRDFARLGVVRGWTGGNVSLFGCSGTLSDEDLHIVQARCAYRQLGALPGQLQVYREAIDRPNLSLRLCPMPPPGQNQFDGLSFLCDEEPVSQSVPGGEMVSSQHPVLPRSHLEIPVTLVYIDNHARLITAQDYLRSRLVRVGFSSEQSISMVRIFWSKTDPIDKDILERDLAQEQPSARIVLCTMALSMGLDCPCVHRVVQFGTWPNACMASLWQRFCRAARRRGMNATVYIFLPRAIFELVYAKQGNGSSAIPWGQCIHTPIIADTHICSCVRDGQGDAASELNQECTGLISKVQHLTRLRGGGSQYPLHLIRFVAAPCIRRFLLAYLSESKTNMRQLLSGVGCCNGRHCMTRDEISASIPVLPPKRLGRVAVGSQSKRMLENVLRPFLSRYSEELAQENGLVTPVGLGSLFAESDVALADSLRTFVARKEPCLETAISAHLAGTLPLTARPLLWALDPGLVKLGAGIHGLWSQLWSLVQHGQLESELGCDHSATDDVEAALGVGELGDQSLGLEGLHLFDHELEPVMYQQASTRRRAWAEELEPPAAARFDAPISSQPVASTPASRRQRRPLSTPGSLVNARLSPVTHPRLSGLVEVSGVAPEEFNGDACTSTDITDRVYSVKIGVDGIAGRKRRRPEYLDGYEVEYSSSPSKSPRYLPR